MQNIQTITVTPIVDTAGAYTSGDRCGAVQTLADASDASGQAVLLESLAILSKVVITTPAFYIMFFNDLPTVASADNAAINISDAEMDKCVGLVIIGAGSFKALAASHFGEVKSVSTIMTPIVGKKDLYAQAVVEAAPTFTTTTDLTFRYKIRKF